MWRRKVAVAAVAAVLMLLLPGSAIANPAATDQETFECPERVICIYDLHDGGGESYTINITWQGGYNLEAVNWHNKVSSITNNEQIPLNLLDGRYGDCVILDRIEPGESKNLFGLADNNTDLIDYDSGDDICPPQPECPDTALCTWSDTDLTGQRMDYYEFADMCHDLRPSARSYINNRSGIEGYFYSGPSCTGDLVKAVFTETRATDIGFTVLSFKPACVSCR